MFIRFVTAVSCALIALSCMGAAPARTGGPARQIVTIDENSLGMIKSIEGGGIHADVVPEGSAANGATPKHLGAVRYEDITIQVSPFAPIVQQLIQETLSGNPRPRNGTVVAGENDNTILSEARFTNALLSEFTIPALDGSSKDAGYFTIKLTPESIRPGKGGGNAAGDKVDSKTKAWLTSNFRIEVGNLPCNRVARVEPLTVKLLTGVNSAGVDRVQSKQPASLQLPNLRLSISRADAQPWQAWFDEFVIQGKNAPANEKSGALILLSPNMKDELLRIDLFNIGIARLAPEPREANSEKIARFEVELYFERMALAGVGNAPAAKAPETPAVPAPESAPPPPPATTTAAAADASQPAAPPAPGPVARMKSPLATRAPRAAATESETYVIQPNLKLPKDAGRLVVRFPEGIRKRDNQRIQFPKDKTEKNAEINWGSVAKEMPPGDYLVTVNGKLIEGVKVEPGADTLVRVGVLRFEVPENQTWEIIEEDLDSAPSMFYAGGPADVGLPVGKYYVRTKSEISPVTIEEGKFTTFPAAGAATKQ
ncbi:MAG: hypothetical protein QOF78_977 [Phycisphaerales bacterium]|jgi:hypothetical protein|nr:hypothetical protein [Phycisphaerales bacterium]